MIKCTTCVSKGNEKEADVIWDGYSFCIEHWIEHIKQTESVYKKFNVTVGCD